MTLDAIDNAVFAAGEIGVRLDLLAGTGTWSLDGTVRHAEALARIARSTVLVDPGVILARVVVRFPDGSWSTPDLAVYPREPDEEDTAVTLIPEAVVEVVSKGSEIKDFEIGPAFYLGQGVKDVIVFDPFSLLTIHHRRDRPPVRHSETTEIRLECGCLVTV